MNSDDADLVARIRRLGKPLAPVPTGVTARCPALPGIRAVLFDVYGTLLVSSAGDLDASVDQRHAGALGEAFASSGISAAPSAGQRGVDLLLATIRSQLAARRTEGVAHPEIDILDVWRDVADALRRDGLISGGLSSESIVVLAVEYECRVNPTWPMPGAREILDALPAAGCQKGLVANAQFYTPVVIEALMGPPPEISAWSYLYGMAKPEAELIRIALGKLREQFGIVPGEVLFIGNDMEKDVLAAAHCGCRTALFAGDARSFRPAAWKPSDVPPDAVVTELAQIPGILGLSNAPA